MMRRTMVEEPETTRAELVLWQGMFMRVYAGGPADDTEDAFREH